MSSPLLQPVVTPRFVPSCSRDLMTGLGELARRLDLPVQTHISESRGEVAWVKALEKGCHSYAKVGKTVYRYIAISADNVTCTTVPGLLPAG